MTGREAIKTALETTRGNLHWYLSDFTDADLFVRPVPAANHAAWQVGNVIAGDVYLIKSELPGTPFPELPPEFMELHGSKGAAKDGPEGFLLAVANAEGSYYRYMKAWLATRSGPAASDKP